MKTLTSTVLSVIVCLCFLGIGTQLTAQNYDVTLSKSTIANGISDYNITVPFNITITNEGLLPVKNIDVVDYVPTGYVYLASDNVGLNWNWDPGNRKATNTVTDTLDMNEFAVLTINLRPQPSPVDTNWINAAEITDAEDITGVSIDGQDADSNYDDTQGNELLGEDDYDEASVPIYDLALRKTLLTPQNTYMYGGDVQYLIQVFNQGNIAVQNVRITDYIPEGYVYNQGDNAAQMWVANGATPYKYLTGVIAPGDSTQTTITLELSMMMADGQAWDNYTGIDSAFTTLGIPLLDDADSNPGSNSQSENVVEPNGPDDNNIDGGGPLVNEDEDDHDVASLEIFDFALMKTKITAPESYSYGQTVSFATTVFNQGNQEADTVAIVDYIPCGYHFSTIFNSSRWDYDSLSRIARYKISPAPLPDEDSIISIVLEVAPCYNDSTAWDNYAEIEYVIDTLDNVRNDIDSRADAIPDNDNGGVPGTSTDDQLDGDGTIDEDDHDPRDIEVVDFALKKVVFSPDTARYGEVVTFLIRGYNQGNIPLYQVDIRDDIPEGYTYIPADNLGWTVDPDEPQWTFPGPIAPGDSVDAFIDLVLNQTQEIECEWVNYGELVQLRDFQGNRDDDADSFSAFETAAEANLKPGDPDDDNIFALGTNFGQDQDDHDPAQPEVFDLALVKKVVDTPPYRFDDLLEFEFTVYNQGNRDASEFNVIDYIPDGLSFDVNDQSFNWIEDVNGNATLQVTSDLSVRDSVKFSIFLTLECVSGGLDVWTNAGEITSAIDDRDSTAFDIDSDYDMINGNDVGGTPGTAEDNLATDSGNDVDGDGVFDEDDHDVEKIQMVDLAVKKTVVTNGPYTFNTPIEFEIEVYNQGNIPLDSVRVIDYLSPGFAFVQGSNLAWSPLGGDVTYTFPNRLMPGDSATTSIFLTYTQVAMPTGREDYVNYVEIYSARDTLNNPVAGDDVDSNPQSNSATERGVEIDSPDDNNILSKDRNGEEDDHDPAGIINFDLSLSKTVITEGPYRYGDIVTYNIVVTNEGTVPASNIEITDELGCGLVFLASNEPTWSYNNALREATTTYTGTIMAGQTATIPITVQIEYCTSTYDAMTYNNVAEITDDKDENNDDVTDSDSTPDNDDPDEDDQDDEPLPVYDLAVSKDDVTSPIGIVDGDDVVFTFTVYNQGSEDLNDVEVIDYIPTGFTFMQGLNPRWTPQGNDAVFTISSLDSQTDTTFTITLSYESSGDNWVNYTEIFSAENDADEEVADEDADSTPGNNSTPASQEEVGGGGDGNITTLGNDGFEDDNDPADFGSLDLALTKELTNRPSNLKYGGLITYTITVTNEGTLPAQSIEVKDQLPCGLSYDSVNDGTWSYTANNRTAVTTLNGVLAPGTSTTVDIQLALTYCSQIDGYTNVAQISDHETPDDPNPTDDDSTPDNNVPSEDDQDDAPTPVVDMSIVKTVVNPGTLAMGSDVVFGIEIYNQGNVDIESVTIEDYFGSGYSLNDGNWSSTAKGAERTINQLIRPNSSIQTTITLSLVAAPNISDYYNWAEVISAGSQLLGNVADEDVDSEPGSDTPTERSVIPGSPDDNNRFGNGPTFNEDEDDHDVAGVDPFGSIGDFVFKDLDNDGIQDSNEPGVDDVGVTLQTCQGQFIASTTTEDGGEFIFENIVGGTYQLVFDISGQNGCIFTTQNVGNPALDSDPNDQGITNCFVLNPGEEKEDVDAGLTGLSDIGDYVFEDLDGDGFQDFNEPGISGVTVNLYSDIGNLLETTTTSFSGFYLFEDIAVGSYYLEFLPQDTELIPTEAFASSAAFDSNIDGSNGQNTTPTFALQASNDDLTQDAGFYRCVQICGFVWYDLDEDNRRDIIENGITGMMINLYRRNQFGSYVLLGTEDTGMDPNSPSGDGYFEFCARPGTYYIEVPLPPYGLVLAQRGVGGDRFRDSDLGNFFGPATSTAFSLNSGQGKCDLGAGFYPMATAGEIVWLDSNGDGLRDQNEPRVADVVVEVYNTNHEKIAESVTDVSGVYDIDYLQQEEYYMKFLPPSSYGFTAPMADPAMTAFDSDVDHTNGPNTTRFVMMAAGQHTGDIDAGLAFGVLPVTWGDIHVIGLESSHKLTWTTETEINTAYYSVERSIQNGPFEEINTVESLDAASGSTYSILDKDVLLNGLYTYRVKQVDLDGRFGYSPQVRISVESTTDIRLFPNPASSMTTLLINTDKDAEISYSIYNARGQVVRYEQLGVVKKGGVSLDIDVDQLAAGIYTAKIKIGEEVNSKQLFVIR